MASPQESMGRERVGCSECTFLESTFFANAEPWFNSLIRRVRGFDKAVRKTSHPTAVSIPGYILPRNLPGSLFLQSDSPVANISVDPQGSLSVTLTGNATYTLTPRESARGRARVTVAYSDGEVQTIHYYITKSAPETYQAMRHFLTTEAHFTHESDPLVVRPK
ncbi:putative glycoside hydrolase family 43 protein [Colletotrichum scovillei]|uniref:Glycoside hydrolase family 43 protein n=1 Tax=Colletotrichum scovillei TaxID=1209932 RepID=A0A9P7QUE8_9PEZI|nr:putative glycoside hydrolase family 43 protein [Colletotrichum scovillei]KAG7060420.1 putative glycoside hydrolase family 43 protein [Colletotrichum scovillei]